MTSTWQPYREPVRTTLLRTGLIALGIGIALSARGGMARLPSATLVALWPALGGHFVELFFLNWLRPRISPARGVQVMARVAIWFVAGGLLALAMEKTAVAIGHRPLNWAAGRPLGWTLAVGGLGFIAVELIAHGVMRLRGVPCFYDGRG